jgi:hypothetical protein
MWELWFQKSWSGIAHALLMDILWPTRFWYALCLFGITRPFSFGAIVKGLVTGSEEVTVDDSVRYVDSLLILSGYTITLLLFRIFSIFFVFIRHLLGVIWRYPLWACTICAFPLSLWLLIHTQRIRMADFRAKLNRLTLSLILWIPSFHFRVVTLSTKLWESFKKSSFIRICKLCLKNGGLRILGHRTFDQLEEFTYPPLPSDQRQIRLLRLHRQIPFFDLKAELVCYPLDHAPPFEAISYVWGQDLRKPHPVILDEKLSTSGVPEGGEWNCLIL